MGSPPEIFDHSPFGDNNRILRWIRKWRCRQFESVAVFEFLVLWEYRFIFYSLCFMI
nr:MAG TPA: hypothetical protein [Caudoviricetes sp.]